MEITSTRFNPNVAPLLEVWGWDVALYLLFSGMAAGVLVIAAVQFLAFGEPKTSPMMRLAVIAAAVTVPLAMLGLLHDLANKANILAFYKYWNLTSTMAVGARALLVIPPVALLFGLVLVQDRLTGRWAFLAPWVKRLEKAKVLLGRLTLASGLFLGTYTGVLLSANFGRPLWNTPLLPLLFLVSGLSTGAAALTLFSRDEHERDRLTKLDIGLIAIELSVILLMLLGFATTTRSQHEALGLLTDGPYGSAFWVLVVGFGLAVPLVLEQLQVRRRILDTPVPSLMVLIGGLALRAVIVFAGQASSVPNT
ncbi:MAG: polysulfide reductase NrfD [Armatimonadetes bacterium]|nr:polysulfide reductase NrfD [Armatimonadota bacterium]